MDSVAAVQYLRILTIAPIADWRSVPRQRHNSRRTSILQQPRCSPSLLSGRRGSPRMPLPNGFATSKACDWFSFMAAAAPSSCSSSPVDILEFLSEQGLFVVFKTIFFMIFIFSRVLCTFFPLPVFFYFIFFFNFLGVLRVFLMNFLLVLRGTMFLFVVVTVCVCVFVFMFFYFLFFVGGAT